MKRIKMKRMLSAVAVLVVLAQPVAFSETVSAPTIAARATVADAFTISVELKRDIPGFPDLPSDTLMDFGTLIPINGALAAAEGVAAFVTVNSQQMLYSVTSTISAPLTSGLNMIPSGAFVLNPAYSPADNNGAPNEGILGAPGLAGGAKLLYQSGGTNSMRTIQAHYMITADPALGAMSFVPLDQPGGVYTTTVVISATR